MNSDVRLIHGDCLEEMRQMPDGGVDLVLTDPPYNARVVTVRGGVESVNQWDVIPGYEDWSMAWIKECQRLLKPNGVMYFWHNDMAQIANLLVRIKAETDLRLVSFCIWDKGETFRAQSWLNRRPDGETALRSWFNRCEYCLHFFNDPKIDGKRWNQTGLDMVNDNPNCYKQIKDWYLAELDRLGLAKADIADQYTKATGKKPYMLRHYFNDSQFEIPTKAVWESVYEPLGFGQSYGDLRQSYERLRQSYEGLRQYYEDIRQTYEDRRNVHVCDQGHCNVWREPPIPANGRYHTCQKPVKILERLINVSSRPGAVVLDCFAGSGSTGIACLDTGRKFIGIERDAGYYGVMRRRIDDYMLAYTE